MNPETLFAKTRVRHGGPDWWLRLISYWSFVAYMEMRKRYCERSGHRLHRDWAFTYPKARCDCGANEVNGAEAERFHL